jgi:hypothetical protein
MSHPCIDQHPAVANPHSASLQTWRKQYS